MCRSYARESPSFASGTISSLSSSYLYHTTCIMLHADSVESGTNSTGQKICTAMTPRVSPQGGALSSPRCLKRNIPIPTPSNAGFVILRYESLLFRTWSMLSLMFYVPHTALRPAPSTILHSWDLRISSTSPHQSHKITNYQVNLTKLQTTKTFIMVKFQLPLFLTTIALLPSAAIAAGKGSNNPPGQNNPGQNRKNISSNQSIAEELKNEHAQGRKHPRFTLHAEVAGEDEADLAVSVREPVQAVTPQTTVSLSGGHSRPVGTKTTTVLVQDYDDDEESSGSGGTIALLVADLETDDVRGIFHKGGNEMNIGQRKGKKVSCYTCREKRRLICLCATFMYLHGLFLTIHHFCLYKFLVNADFRSDGR